MPHSSFTPRLQAHRASLFASAGSSFRASVHVFHLSLPFAWLAPSLHSRVGLNTGLSERPRRALRCLWNLEEGPQYSPITCSFMSLSQWPVITSSLVHLFCVCAAQTPCPRKWWSVTAGAVAFCYQGAFFPLTKFSLKIDLSVGQDCFEDRTVMDEKRT